MNQTRTLGDAIDLATMLHSGQLDKQGQPYILHPMRVMLSLADDLDRQAAILHDVVEDCDITVHTLRELGYDADVVDAIDAVTKRPNEPYADFIRRAAANEIGRRVKRADIIDNLNRMIPSMEFKRQTYTDALNYLETGETA